MVLMIALLAALAVWPVGPAPGAKAEPAPPGGAPAPGSGDREVAGYVRVIDGDSLEPKIDGQRVAVGLIGLEAPQGNTACGRAATGALQGLVARGVRLAEVAGLAYDARGRRLY